MNVSDFDYHLPEELIAQHPVPGRKTSRMLRMEPDSGNCDLLKFEDFPSFLRAGDCLVLNNTRVIPARLFGKRDPSGGKVEALLLEELENRNWKCMLKPGRRMHAGGRVILEGTENEGFIVDKRGDDGTFEIHFENPEPYELLEACGHIPLPPYIQRPDESGDHEKYQTVYAKNPGAVAAPTAGLHFTPDVLQTIKEKGVNIAEVTLHVGAGTFRPVQVENIEDHVMHEETYILTPETSELINRTKSNGGRIIAVGTTSVRVLESCVDGSGNRICPGSGKTRLFLHPPKRPNIVDALLTNFHLPKSTLIMLVSTFSSRKNVLNAYKTAVENRFRFYSYGDCMLVI